MTAYNPPKPNTTEASPKMPTNSSADVEETQSTAQSIFGPDEGRSKRGRNDSDDEENGGNFDRNVRRKYTGEMVAKKGSGANAEAVDNFADGIEAMNLSSASASTGVSSTLNSTKGTLPDIKATLEAGGTITISAELFNALLLSVESLKKDMALVQSSNTAISQELVAVRRRAEEVNYDFRCMATNAGVDFYLFPKLPAEVQLNVWRLHLEIPRIIGLRGKFITGQYMLYPASKMRPPANPIRFACQASRAEAVLQQTAKFLKFKPSRYGSPKIYDLWSRPETDIMWFADHDEPGTESRNSVVFDFLQAIYDMKLEPPMIAISYDFWIRLSHEEGFEKLMYMLQLLKVQKLILIVKGQDNMDANDVVFADPKDSPGKIFSARRYWEWQRRRERSGRISDAIRLKKLNWQDISRDAMQFIGIRRSIAINAREKRLADGWTVEDVDEIIPDVVDWTLKNIRFMEATSLTKLKEKGELEAMSKFSRKYRLIPSQYVGLLSPDEMHGKSTVW